MKKVLSFVAVLFAVVAVNAQVLYENFDNGMPSNWSTLDVNQTGYPWEAVSQSLTNVSDCPYTADQFSYGETGDCMVSWSYYPSAYTSSGFQGTSLDQNNYLISPAFTPVAGSTLSFYCMSFNGTQYPDAIMVKLSTGGTSEGDFSTTLMPLTTVSWSEWTEQTVDLSAYAGQNVRIAFVHQSNDMFGLLLDEVTVTGGQTGIAENNNSISIYPNPATSVLNVEAEGFSTIEMVNVLGQVVYSANATSNMQINVSNLDNGVYFVRLNGANGTATQKFIKK
jgi:hypothetical protein